MKAQILSKQNRSAFLGFTQSKIMKKIILKDDDVIHSATIDSAPEAGSVFVFYKNNVKHRFIILSTEINKRTITAHGHLIR